MTTAHRSQRRDSRAERAIANRVEARKVGGEENPHGKHHARPEDEWKRIEWRLDQLAAQPPRNRAERRAVASELERYRHVLRSAFCSHGTYLRKKLSEFLKKLDA